MLELFGCTYVNATYNSRRYDTCNYRNSSNVNGFGYDQWSTGALFGSDEDNDGKYNAATVQNPYESGVPNNFRDGRVVLMDDNYFETNGRSFFGVALVSSVPEPASLTLFVLGLAGLGFSRRKSKA